MVSTRIHDGTVRHFASRIERKIQPLRNSKPATRAQTRPVPTTKLTLLGLVAAAVSCFAFAAGELTFTVIFMVLSGIALGSVLRARDR